MPFDALVAVLTGLAAGQTSPAPADCPADELASRQAAEARVKRLTREWEHVSVETVKDATRIAGTWRDGLEESWQQEFERRAHRHLQARSGKRARPDDHVDGRLCRALASRDPAGCDALPREGDVFPCRSFLGIASSVKDAGAAGCAALGPELGPACAALFDPREAVCEAAPEPGRSACWKALSSIREAPKVCGPALEATRCAWSAAFLGIAAGKSACDVVSPGPDRTTADHAALDRFCRAVHTATPALCPEEGVGPEWLPVAFADAAVVPGPRGPRVLAALRTDSPAVCRLEMETRRDVGAVDVHAATVLLSSWRTSTLRRDLPLGTPAEGLVASTRVTCLPSLVW